MSAGAGGKSGARADWLPVRDALARVLGGVEPLEPAPVQVGRSLGHVLAEDLVSPIDLPLHDNSAMDGFAVRAVDVKGASGQRPRELPVVADVPAGAPVPDALPPGAAMRVMTGAPVPPGADSVVRVEHTDGGALHPSGEGSVLVTSDADAHRNIRRRGEDLRRGDLVLARGRVIRPAELAVAASIGAAELRVIRRPTVAILTSGDELVDVAAFDQVLAGRRIVSTNSYSLAAQLSEIGAEVRDLGIAPDSADAMRRMLEGARGCDALITSAGISMGEHDLVRGVLDEMGAEIDFWRVKMRPGSPFAFGHLPGLGGIPWFGLPGNPVSSMVTFEVFARPAILKMCGRSAIFAPTVAARVADDPGVVPGLTHFLRVRLRPHDGHAVATITGAQGSGILSSMADADGLLVVPEAAECRAGSTFPVLVLGGAPLREEPGY